MAADPDLIAYLYPYSHGVVNHSEATIRMRENAPLRIEPRIEDHARRPSQSPNRFADQDSDDDDDCGDDFAAGDAYWDIPGLQLRFDHARNNRAGFVFGTSPNCDIVLPMGRGVPRLARRQCVLAFDHYGRLVLRDVQTPRADHKRGTAVEYNGKGGGDRGKRRDFTWILSGSPFATEAHEIVIALHDNLKFLLVVEPHDFSSPQYQHNVSQFPACVRHDADALSIGGLSLGSTGSTVTPSGAQSPGADAILLNDRVLGRGGQAVVKHVWNVSTAEEYASKEPAEERWKRRLRAEVVLLKSVSHVSPCPLSTHILSPLI